MPWSCYNYSLIILTATVDLLPFAAILHNKNNACDIFYYRKTYERDKHFNDYEGFFTVQVLRFEHPLRRTRLRPRNPRRAQHRQWAHSLRAGHHPSPPNSYKHHSRLLHCANVCNLHYSIQLVVPTNIQISHSISVYIRDISSQICLLHLFNTISAPSPLKCIFQQLKENHSYVPWQTQLKTMTSINARKSTVYKQITSNADILSVILQATV